MSARLLLRSVDRTSDSTSSASFRVTLRNPIEGKYCLKNCLISNTIYNINSYNNSFAFTDGSGAYTGVTLTPGVYDSSGLVTEMKARMEAANSGARTFTITYSSTTSKLTFVPSAGNLSFQFGTYTTNSAYRAFGMNQSNGVAASSVVSTNAVQLDFASSLLIHIDEAKRSGIFETSNPTNPTSFSLYVPLDTSFGAYKSLDTGNFKQFLDLPLTKTFTVRVTDSNNNLIDLNAGEWEMLFEKIE